ncbi:MAG: hypothetical protein JWR26_3341 [Pedosphaera sp.]|nr:hypothetical protein [Pedosphaera sp.]
MEGVFSYFASFVETWGRYPLPGIALVIRRLSEKLRKPLQSRGGGLMIFRFARAALFAKAYIRAVAEYSW